MGEEPRALCHSQRHWVCSMTHEQAQKTMAEVMDYQASLPWRPKDCLLCIVAVGLLVATIVLFLR
jgi:hypothetical protein